MSLERIKKRRTFQLATHNGKKFVASGVILQVIPSEREDVFRLGFTTTKKLGNAVVRNRIRRRLRAVAQQVAPEYALNGFDYVLIGRKVTLDIPFLTLLKDAKYVFKSFKKYHFQKQQLVDSAMIDQECSKEDN